MYFQILRGEEENRIEKDVGRCFNPLIVFIITSLFFGMDFLLFSGDTSLLASLEGENDLRSLAAADDARGDFLAAPPPRVGDIHRGGLLIFTWNFEAAGGGGDLIKNLCGVCRFLAIMGDFVLPNF